MSTTANADTELLDPWQPATSGAGAPPPPPPPPAGGSFPSDPDGLMEPSFAKSDAPPPGKDAEAARGEVMSQWADDAGGTPIDAARTVGDLQGQIPQSEDKAQVVTALETAAEQKRQDVEKHVAAEEAKVDAKGEQAKEEATKEVKDAHPTEKDIKEGKPAEHHGGGKLQHPHGPHADKDKKPEPPVTKDALKAKVTETVAKELEQLEEGYTKQQAQLEEKFAAQLGSLDAEQKKQEAKIAGHVGAGDAQMDGAIQGHEEAHKKEIAAEQKKIDAEVGKQSEPVGKQGDTDAEKPVAEAKVQAQATRDNALKKAEEVRAKTKAEADNARRQGKTSGDEALAAAQAQAARVPEAERAGITAAGEKRKAMALAEADSRARAIEQKGEAEAKSIAQQGEKDAQAQIKRGAEAAAKAKATAKAGQAKIKGEGDKAHAHMQQISDDAVGKMKGAKDEADAKSKAQAGKSSGAMGDAQKEAKGTADKEKADALAKMKQTYEGQKKKIQDKGKAELDKIEKAKDGDLRHLAKQVDGDLKALEKMAEEADTRMKAQVKLAEQKLAAKVRQQKQKMRAEAVKALAAINKFVAEAKRKIHASNQGVSKAIHDAGKEGKQAVHDLGPKVLAEVTDTNKKDLEATIKAADDERRKLDARAAAVEGDLAKDAQDVKGAIKDKMVKDALASVKGDLTREHWYSYISDKEATRAMNALASLPKDARGDAMKDLPKEQFDNLLGEVPKARREDFEALVESCHDPKRKLQLWKEYHDARTDNKAAREKDKDTGVFYKDDTRTQQANKTRNKHRDEAAAEEHKEADEEMQFLLDKEKKGGTITEDDVDKLYARKKQELDIEMKYGVNLTNEKGTRKDGSKIVWETSDLDELDKTLQIIPKDNMGGNKNLAKIERDGQHSAGAGVGGMAAPGGENPGVIHIYDTGANAKDKFNGNFRVNGDPRSGPVICQACGMLITRMDAVLIHELGHNIHQYDQAAFKKYLDAGGWKTGLGDAELKAAGISDADIQKMKDTRDAKNPDGTAKNGYQSQFRVKGKDGKMYQIDPYSGSFLAVDADATPVDPSGNFATGKWGYAQSNYMDAFAEHYMFATTKPEELYKDLVGGPTADVKAAQDDVNSLPAGPAHDKAQAKLDAALATQKKRQAEFDVMRNDVFHTNDKQAELVKDLKAKGIDTTGFEKDAEKLSTPEQVEKRAKRYELGTNTKQAKLVADMKAKGIDTTKFEQEAERLETPADVEALAKTYNP